MFKVTLEYKKGFHEILLRHTINIQKNCNKSTESNKKCVDSLHKNCCFIFFVQPVKPSICLMQCLCCKWVIEKKHNIIFDLTHDKLVAA